MASPVALVCIDMQYIHVHPDFAVSGKSCSPESQAYTRQRLAETVLPSAARLLEGFRAKGALVVHVVFNHQAPDGSDLDPAIYARPNISGNPQRDTWSIRRRDDPLSAILVEVAPLRDEIVLEKVTHSSFASTNLNNVMTNHKVQTIVHCGGLTDCCVKATAKDAKRLGYRAVCVPDACVARSAETHAKGLADPDYDAFLTVGEALGLLG